MFHRPLQQSFPLRRGVTLLEVMFSIGIISVGLLGTIVLIPLASHEAKEGAKADVGATMGKSMVEEFQIRFMKDPRNWFRATGNNGPVPHSAFTDPVTMQPINQVNANNTIPTYTRNQAFCFDPRFVAAFNAGIQQNLINGNINNFPYTPFMAGDYSPMMRATLPSGLGGRMGVLQAQELFVAQNDVTFDKPDDSLLPPIQQWSTDSNQALVKRQSDGAFSWMATVAPKIDVNFNPNTSPPLINGPTGTFSDLYTLSIIVFHDRDPTMEVNTINERVLTVTAFPGLGIGGGDMVFRPLAASTTQVEDLDIKRHNWVMLFGDSSDGRMYRWFRVVGVDEIQPQANGPPTRNVTLHGPDWNRDEFTNLNTTTYVAVIHNVVAVYEKTIRFETSSLWTN